MSSSSDTGKDSTVDQEMICDLDALTSKKVTFTLHGKAHVLLPITTRAFAEFWNQVLLFQSNKRDNINDQNKAYFETVKTLCKTLTLKDVEQMTLMQKTVLLEALASKVVGDKKIFDVARNQAQSQKKNLNPSSVLLS